MELKIHESMVDEQRFRAVLNEKQILAIIVEAVATAAGIDALADNVSVRTLHISSRSGGFNTGCEAVCELVVNRAALPRSLDNAAPNGVS